ncbi:hypothetical protein LY78DRAFT_324357 [Colletotrichum sublineola]|nr:hypothetical protein LY78DRAFT_324357 [Colletotrichum sublineola]
MTLGSVMAHASDEMKYAYPKVFVCGFFHIYFFKLLSLPAHHQKYSPCKPVTVSSDMPTGAGLLNRAESESGVDPFFLPSGRVPAKRAGLWLISLLRPAASFFLFIAQKDSSRDRAGEKEVMSRRMCPI